MPAEDVPAWDGDPSSFEAFATSCRWFECSLKETERKLAAPRIWQKLQGAAKSVVRHLDPKDFSSDTGLEKLLRVLRDSPLQKLPIPDSFSRLEKWTGLKRAHGEAIPQLLVREEELFTELQQALQRARHERARHEVKSMGVGASERDPPMSPTRSPNVTRAGLSSVREDDSFEAEDEKVVETSQGENAGFFEHELRGYRLLKAAKLTQAERQHVLTLTKNSTHFTQIRQALRSLFSDGADQADDPGRMPRRSVWYAADEGEDWGLEDDWWSEDPSWWSEDIFWNDWSPSWSPTSWDDGGSYEDYIQENDYYPEEPEEKTNEELENEQRVEEAFALATEANKTLAEARQAVARVRAARGYFDPTGTKGHPGSLGGGKGKRKGPASGKGKGVGGGFGPCFICGQPGHGYLKCPDRWSKGGKKGASPSSSRSSSFGGRGKGKGKGGSKGKKGKTFFAEAEWVPEVYVMSLFDQTDLESLGTSKVVLESGATESVAGIRAMAKVLDSHLFTYEVNISERPRFKFGNGESQRAASKVWLHTPALGWLSFYLLDGGAEMTPLLLGARDMRKRRAVISYHGDYMVHRGHNGAWFANELITAPGGHLTLSLATHRLPLRLLLEHLDGPPFNNPGGYGGDDENADGGDDGRPRPPNHPPPGRTPPEGGRSTTDLAILKVKIVRRRESEKTLLPVC